MRCRTRALIGPAILVALGVLFLLDEYSWIRFDDSWPVLLIVIGLLSFAARSGSTEGHIPPRWLNWPAAKAGGQNDPQQSATNPQQGDPDPQVKP